MGEWHSGEALGCDWNVGIFGLIPNLWVCVSVEVAK